MCRKVVRPEVRLDLDKPSPQDLAFELTDEDLAEKVAGHRDRVPIEERRP
jgi:hypothetical protein